MLYKLISAIANLGNDVERLVKKQLQSINCNSAGQITIELGNTTATNASNNTAFANDKNYRGNNGINDVLCNVMKHAFSKGVSYFTTGSVSQCVEGIAYLLSATKTIYSKSSVSYSYCTKGMRTYYYAGGIQSNNYETKRLPAVFLPGRSAICF
jgi:hypothetical protein